MYVIATFEQSIFLEMAITALEHNGIASEQILAVPLDKRTEPRQLLDTIHRADGFSVVDLAAILGTVFMLLGTIYGYVLAWGPVIWGFIGGCFGSTMGFLIKWSMLRNKTRGRAGASKNVVSEVVLLLECDNSQWETVETILWDNTAAGISRVQHAGPHDAKKG